MNVLLNGLQSGTQSGARTLPAAVDLTGCENLLWKVVNNGGAANFALPTAAGDVAVFIGASGGPAGSDVAAEAPDLAENARVMLDGDCSPGDALSLSPAKWGRIYKPAAGAGAVYYQFIAEEAGADGQLVVVRPISPWAVTL